MVGCTPGETHGRPRKYVLVAKLPFSKDPTNPAGFSSGSRNSETHDTPKCNTSSGWSNCRPSPANARSGAGRRPFDIPQESTGCGQTLASASTPCRAVAQRTNFPPQLADVAEGLNYLHSCDMIHGHLNGVRHCPRSYSLRYSTAPVQQNVFVDGIGHARITGSDLAPARGTSAGHDRSARWIAPEALGYWGPHTKEADVFSFAGVTIEVRSRHLLGTHD